MRGGGGGRGRGRGGIGHDANLINVFFRDVNVSCNLDRQIVRFEFINLIMVVMLLLNCLPISTV